MAADTPYAGGVFRVRLVLGREFPSAPPRAYFLTRIFHPNVSPATGEVCVNTLKRDWKPELGLEHALLAVKCLLIAPNPESALNAEAAALLRDRYDDYFARAKLLADIHARPRQPQPTTHHNQHPQVRFNLDIIIAHFQLHLCLLIATLNEPSPIFSFLTTISCLDFNSTYTTFKRTFVWRFQDGPAEGGAEEAASATSTSSGAAPEDGPCAKRERRPGAGGGGGGGSSGAAQRAPAKDKDRRRILKRL